MTTRGYRWIVLGVIAVALLATVVVRAPRSAAPRAAAIAPAPVVALDLAVSGGAVEPSVSEVPKGHRVKLSIVNRGVTPVSVTLAGYEPRVRADGIAPGATWRGEFVADLPGEGFAWLVDGEPVGRLVVTGAHLMEGHR